MTARTTMFNNESPSVRPSTSADRAIGSDLNRSIKPFFISSANPEAVAAKVKATVCTNIPGINS